MSELVFFLEEPSVQAMLEGLLPQLLQGEVSFATFPTQPRSWRKLQMVTTRKSLVLGR